MLRLETCGKALEMLERLARLRQQVDAKGMSEAEGNVHANRLIMERTMRSPTEEEKSTLILEKNETETTMPAANSAPCS